MRQLAGMTDDLTVSLGLETIPIAVIGPRSKTPPVGDRGRFVFGSDIVRCGEHRAYAELVHKPHMPPLSSARK